MSTVGGFTILPLRYSSSATHNLYIRPHSGSRPKGLPEARTLFLVNVPPDATERELAALFAAHGTVEKVVFSSGTIAPGPADDDDDDEEMQDEASASSSDDDAHPRKKRKLDKKKPHAPPTVEPLPAAVARTLRPSGASAHLVFLDPSSLQRALAAKPAAWPPKTAHPEPCGLAHYAARHAALRPPLSAVLAHASSAILVHDWSLERERRAEKARYKKGEEVVDEDGFTLVVRGGAYGQAVGGGVGVASKRFELGEGDNKPKKRKKEKEGFYAFQVREKNLKEHAELRKKFEQDKKKVEDMQKKRAFVPY